MYSSHNFMMGDWKHEEEVGGDIAFVGEKENLHKTEIMRSQ
jgi:hypothetical protein